MQPTVIDSYNNDDDAEKSDTKVTKWLLFLK